METARPDHAAPTGEVSQGVPIYDPEQAEPPAQQAQAPEARPRRDPETQAEQAPAGRPGEATQGDRQRRPCGRPPGTGSPPVRTTT